MIDIKRFIYAQSFNYNIALREIKKGKKITHWMWYIFPQLIGLSESSYGSYYAIKDLNEVKEYLNDPILGKRLIDISKALLKLNKSSIEIFGEIDSLKLQSCMTLFNLIDETDPIFQLVLDKFFEGIEDINTIIILSKILRKRNLSLQHEEDFETTS